jgi:hypothetical protein
MTIIEFEPVGVRMVSQHAQDHSDAYTQQQAREYASQCAKCYAETPSHGSLQTSSSLSHCTLSFTRHPVYTWFRSINSLGYGFRYTCRPTHSGTG